MPVDGQPRTFVFVGGNDAWCATRRVDGRRVRVSAFGWQHSGIALVTVTPASVSNEIPERV